MCTLLRQAQAVFAYTNLEKADLLNSINIVLDPENNKIKEAKFSLASLPGLLGKYEIKVEN